MNGGFPLKRKLTFCALLAMLMFAGCATTPKVNWNNRVGHYTYDQAVIDMGPPDKATRLSDGRTVAEWIYHRRGGMSFGFGTGFGGGGSAFGMNQGVSTGFSDKVLRLTFAPDGVLTGWNKNY